VCSPPAVFIFAMRALLVFSLRVFLAVHRSAARPDFLFRPCAACISPPPDYVFVYFFFGSCSAEFVSRFSCSPDFSLPLKSAGPVSDSVSCWPGLNLFASGLHFCSGRALVSPAPPVFDCCVPFFRSRGKVLVWGCSSVFRFRL
jgi:hypothetical protein